LIEASESEERAHRKRQIKLQEKEIVEKRKRRRLALRREVREEAVARMKVDPSITWDDAIRDAQERLVDSDSN